jgi:hypothetical protein
MRSVRAAGWLLCSTLFACAGAPVQVEEPALLTADKANAPILKAAIEGALGVPVELAGDALTRQSLLIIDRKPAMVDGQLINGRELGRPERFTLLLVKGECMLRREGSEELLALAGATCLSNATAR